MLPIPSVKGFASFLSEMWSLFLRIGSCDGHRVYRFTREVWKARVGLASTHYFESEITSWLRTSKYIALNLTSKSEQIENIGRNIFIKCSLVIAFDPTLYKNCETRNRINWSKNSLLVCKLIKLLFARIHNFRVSYFS